MLGFPLRLRLMESFTPRLSLRLKFCRRALRMIDVTAKLSSSSILSEASASIGLVTGERDRLRFIAGSKLNCTLQQRFLNQTRWIRLSCRALPARSHHCLGAFLRMDDCKLVIWEIEEWL